MTQTQTWRFHQFLAVLSLCVYSQWRRILGTLSWHPLPERLKTHLQVWVVSEATHCRVCFSCLPAPIWARVLCLSTKAAFMVTTGFSVSSSPEKVSTGLWVNQSTDVWIPQAHKSPLQHAWEGNLAQLWKGPECAPLMWNREYQLPWAGCMLSSASPCTAVHGC